MPTSSPKAAPSGDARLASLRKVCGEIDKLVDRYEQEQLPTDGRMPVLDAKAELMLNYTTQLVGYVQESVRSGRSGDVDPSVFESLFRTRLVLTKLRPIETKLEYSIERILNEDPARANRHRPGQLSDSIYADDAGKLDEENDGEQLYRAPKTSSVEYSADSSTHDAQLKKAEAKLAREERKLRNSEFFQAVKEAAGDFTDNFSKPQEVRLDEDDGLCSRRQKALRVEAEKRAYEEDNLVRLRRTKAEKKELSKKTRRGGAGVVGLGELVSELDRNFGAGKYEKFKEARGNLEGLRAAKGGGSGAAAKGGSSGEREKKKQGAGDFGKSSTRTGVQKTGGEKRGGKKGGGKKGGGKKGGGKKGGKRR